MSNYGDLRKEILESLQVTRYKRLHNGDAYESQRIHDMELRLLEQLRSFEKDPPVGPNLVLTYAEVLGRTEAAVRALEQAVRSVHFTEELKSIHRRQKATFALLAALVISVITSAAWFNFR